mgnify:CR=1 FL=1
MVDTATVVMGTAGMGGATGPRHGPSLGKGPGRGTGHGHGWGHGHGRGHGHLHGYHGIHADWRFVVPYYDRHYHGSYYVDSGRYYYHPEMYVTNPDSYVVSKPISVDFGGFAHVDDLAGRLERLANELCLDMNYNYPHNPGFSTTYREAYQILETAKYIHAKEHQNDRDEIARRLQELDPLFHHVDWEIRGWSRDHRRQIGRGGVLTKAEMMESILHHLMNDVGIRPHSSQSPEAALAPGSDEIAPPPMLEMSPPPDTLP